MCGIHSHVAKDMATNRQLAYTSQLITGASRWSQSHPRKAIVMVSDAFFRPKDLPVARAHAGGKEKEPGATMRGPHREFWLERVDVPWSEAA